MLQKLSQFLKKFSDIDFTIHNASDFESTKFEILSEFWKVAFKIYVCNFSNP